MLPWLLCGGMALLSVYLTIRLAALHKSLDELRDSFAQNVDEESNVLISLSSRDPHARQCAAQLNRTLRELRAQRRRYQSGDRELKEAVVNISHDLRTPLTAICGYLDLLEQGELSADAARYVSVIRERAEAMRSLSEEMFRYSLIAAEDGSLHPETLSLNGILQESLAAAYTMLKDRGITPGVSLPPVDVRRRLDRRSLSRVFANLLSNAARYSDGDLEIVLSRDGEICFSNRASGLSEVELGRLFDRFYTVDAARRSTGLGLAIARTLTERMGGSITADLAEGVLRIRVAFPPQP